MSFTCNKARFYRRNSLFVHNSFIAQIMFFAAFFLGLQKYLFPKIEFITIRENEKIFILMSASQAGLSMPQIFHFIKIFS